LHRRLFLGQPNLVAAVAAKFIPPSAPKESKPRKGAKDQQQPQDQQQQQVLRAAISFPPSSICL
jgi:hypothetical protein